MQPGKGHDDKNSGTTCQFVIGSMTVKSMPVQMNRPRRRNKGETAIWASSRPPQSSLFRHTVFKKLLRHNLVLGVLGVGVAGVVLELVG